MNRTRTLLIILLTLGASALAQNAKLPNILWITSEDNGPHLGCYGDEFADTPNLDALAKKGMIYRYAWSTAPVCAPARTTLISGVYPPSTGSQHMRSQSRLPEFMKMYPQYLREAGYYCTNNSKEDYNLVKPGKVWDESSRNAHWKNREPGQPFFAIFNHTVSHESQIRKRPHQAVHDPAKVRIPAYHPDIPEARQDWAQYYDKLTEMDALAGENLKELEEAGLADDTIVFYYGDHGAGMPRGKRWPYNSGLQVPLIVHIPEKYKELAPDEYDEGGESNRLVGFIDLAPTLLSLAGVQPPAHMQGHAIMGAHEAEPQPYLFGFRGRMDERFDMVRTVRDRRYIYIKNYMPHKPYGQFIHYMFQTPTTHRWHEMYEAGELAPPKTFFWETKPSEELYDLEADPDEVHNLASSAEHSETVERFRRQQRQWALRIRDLGFLPEAQIHGRAEGSTPYEMGHEGSQYPIEKIMRMAEAASSLETKDIGMLRRGLGDGDSAVRYWAALGFLMRGAEGVEQGRAGLMRALTDDSKSVRAAAAEALGRYGNAEEAKQALDTLMEMASLEDNNVYHVMLAMNALDYMDEKARPALGDIKALPERHDKVIGKMGGYVPRLKEKILADLDGN